MSLRLKFYVLFLCALLLAAGYFRFYWVPQTDRQSEQVLSASIQRHLASIAQGLIPPLLQNQLANTHETLGALLVENPDWLAVVLYDRSGRRLFPFGPLKQLTGDFVRTFEQTILSHDEFLGKVSVTVDLKPKMGRLNRLISGVAATLGGGFAVIMLALALLVDATVRRPTEQLAGAANRLAAGDFDAVLPAARRDEIGSLTASFAFMRDRIRKDRDALSRARDDLEARVRDRTAELREANARLTSEISERRQAEALLTEREAYLRGIMDNSADGIVIIDAQGRIGSINPAACRMFGYSTDEAVGQNVSILMPDPNSSRHDQYLRNYERSGVGKIIGHGLRVLDAKRRDGSIFPVGLSVGEMYLGEKHLYIGSIRDITQRVAAERAIRESEERYRRLIDLCPDGIMVHVDDKIVFCNTKMAEILGAESPQQVIGGSAIKFVPSEDRDTALDRHNQALGGKILPPRETAYQRFDGAAIDVETSLAVVTWRGNPAFLALTRDITERKRHEAQLRQIHKMESLGTLAGGIAHELNNMLLPIGGLTELAMTEIPEHSRAHKNLDTVLKSTRRAGDLVKKILSFSHRDEAKHSSIDLRRLIEEEMDLFRVTLPATVKISLELCDEIVTVLVDETQIHQVLINLASNAVHAIGGKVGELAIGLSTVAIGDQDQGDRLGLGPGAYAKLSVRDDGRGMDKETLERIFDPFFTTKDVGEGTGMGLAMIHGIVTAHGGVIEVESAPGRGTSFTVYLPLLANEHEALGPAG